MADTLTAFRFTSSDKFLSDLLYGIINTAMVVPVSISFCAIIFRDPAFDSFLPSLVKLVLFSSAIHQLSFSIFSSLPFAVGQVQDAGLIFLSGIAGSVASSCANPSNIMATTLFFLAICTSCLGCMLVVVSKLRLASSVQYLPMPVVGGYLAFIGFFCGEAGLAMMAGIEVTSLYNLPTLFTARSMTLILPGVFAGLSMSALLAKFRSPLILPISLLSILIVFFSTLYLSGMTVEEAREYGWLSPLQPMSSPFAAWSLYDISSVEWPLLPRQIPTLLAMFFVVAFSSSLDVAAIEMELGVPLDYNRELETVGKSNVLSGLTGGFTGSYIFTQTTFNMRRGVDNRLCGFVIGICEIIVALLPISIISYIPKLFFGSLLILIAKELMSEWLIVARSKMMASEYAVCLLTFCSIQLVGIEIGMLIGVIGAMISFVISYSKMQSVSPVSVKSSLVTRTFEERTILIANKGKVVTVSFSGYLFFGSAVKLLEQIKANLILSSSTDGQMISSSSSQLLGVISPRLSSAVEQSVCNNPADKTDTSQKREELKSPKARNPQEYLDGTEEEMEPLTRSLKPSSSSKRSSRAAPPATESLKLLFASPRHKPIKTVYEMSPAQIRKQYESWTSTENNSAGNNSITCKSASATPMAKRTNRNIPMLAISSPDIETGASEETVRFLSKSMPNSTIPVDNDDDADQSGESIESFISAKNLQMHQRQQSQQVTQLSLSSSKAPSIVPRLHQIGQQQTQTQTQTQTQKDSKRSVLSQIWEKPRNWTEKSQRLRSFSDLINMTSPRWDQMPDLLLPQLTPRSNASDDFHVPMKRESSYVDSGFQNNRPIVNGVPALALQPSIPPEYLVPKFQSFPSNLYGSLSENRESANELLSSGLSGDIVTEYLVLDFTNIVGIDATSARSCFLTLVHLMKAANVTVVFAHVQPYVEQLLRAHSVLREDSIVIPSFDDALEWCEDQILHRRADGGAVIANSESDTAAASAVGRGNINNNSSSNRQSGEYSQAWAARQQQTQVVGTSEHLTSSDALELVIEEARVRVDTTEDTKAISARTLRAILEDYLDIDPGLEGPFARLLDSRTLLRYFRRESFAAQQIVFERHSQADKVYFMEKGAVEMIILPGTTSDSIGAEVVRINKVSDGGVFGEADFVLNCNHSVRAFALKPSICWTLQRQALTEMETNHPQLCLLVQHAISRSLALSSNCSRYAVQCLDS